MKKVIGMVVLMFGLMVTAARADYAIAIAQTPGYPSDSVAYFDATGPGEYVLQVVGFGSAGIMINGAWDSVGGGTKQVPHEGGSGYLWARSSYSYYTQSVAVAVIIW